MDNQVNKVINHFQFKGELIDCKENKSGNINKTNILTYKDGEKIRKYTLQKLNTFVFKNPEAVMDNIQRVTDHLNIKLKEKYIDYKRRTLGVVKTKDDKSFFKDEVLGFWRAFTYIDNAQAHDVITKPEDLYNAGKAFGEFQSMLADFSVETLIETIPDFHNTPKRLETFIQAVKNNKADRASSIKEEINYILSNVEQCNIIIDSINQGKVKIRVTHNDTKLNNVLIDNETGEGICVIDLDTVMPGTALFDFGDAVRYGASTAVEDEKDLSKVSLNIELFEQFAKGFLGATNGYINNEELLLIPIATKIITI
ncbi:MAG: aminoglycoside phosphotransferase family protein, partial [Oscillospiraceae bacterium]